jgi:hypothetical protein
MEMTRFQKQVLLQEEARVQEKKQEKMDSGGGGTSRTLNARHSANDASFSESVKYKNSHEFETENQVEFADADI